MVHFFHALQQYLLACICIEISHQSCLVFVSFHHAYDGSQGIAQRSDLLNDKALPNFSPVHDNKQVLAFASKSLINSVLKKGGIVTCFSCKI